MGGSFGRGPAERCYDRGGGAVRSAGGESRIPTFTNKLAAQTLAFLSYLKPATFTVFSEYQARISACVSAASGF